MLFGRNESRLKNLLIVEDEPLIAFDNEHFLETLGYAVVATLDNAPEALALLPAGGIDLILADVRLNESSGRDVAVAARQAGIPVLFVTATCPVDAPKIAIGCLAKPYTQKELRQAIEAVEAHLDGAKPRRLPRGLTLYDIDGAGSAG
ncbi:MULTISPECIES: response regulator [unclassified Sphingomonas]|uniref:response regulator n=1 Tax=unclassified Sphingomonas TaxID=196159 RepID=UPI0006F8AD69|nr:MULTISPECIES: response regulator [unclassified Sphingomonas]KQX26352.1 response regulator [Sphingomonas sp. Root1294]KQY69422.1 response regulator [Sphingomonas sp. Root50]KRB89833.1 response regulator [Sphingomonas sp. Root720]